MLDVVQRCGAHREPLLVTVVPLGDARVEVPAVVVEARRRGNLTGRGQVEALELAEAHDDVGHLHARVIDVVLHLHRRAAEAEHAREGVAQDGVADVPDVRGLVRVDGGVFDDGLAGVRRLDRQRPGEPEPGQQERGAIQEHVEVAVGGRIHAGDARHGPEGAGNLLRDGPWRLAEPAGEVERHRRPQVAERAVRRILDDDGQIGVEPVQFGQDGAHTASDLFVKGKDHDGGSLTRSKGVQYVIRIHMLTS